MAYSTEQTIWPASAITEEIKALIARFFSLMDDPSEEVGDVLADEIFTSNGTLAAAAGTAVGSSGMKPCAHSCTPTQIHIYTHRNTKVPRARMECNQDAPPPCSKSLHAWARLFGSHAYRHRGYGVVRRQNCGYGIYGKASCCR